jgi:hypothetical protein
MWLHLLTRGRAQAVPPPTLRSITATSPRWVIDSFARRRSLRAVLGRPCSALSSVQSGFVERPSRFCQPTCAVIAAAGRHPRPGMENGPSRRYGRPSRSRRPGRDPRRRRRGAGGPRCTRPGPVSGWPEREVSCGVLRLRRAITAEPRKLIRGFLTWQSKPGSRWWGRAFSPLPALTPQHPEGSSCGSQRTPAD